MAATPAVPGAILVSSLTGSELVSIATVGPQYAQTTTGDIAALAATESTTEKVTALNTVGAGSLTAAAIVGKNVTRGGTQTAGFTDTTVAASAIIAALPAGAPVGSSFTFSYTNNTSWPATLAGGSGVTLAATVPARSSARFLVTLATASTITFSLLSTAFGTTASGTFVANGTTPVTVANANVTPESAIVITLKTAGGTVGVSAPAIQTITPGTGFTVAALALDTSTYNYLILG
jgi:hypothetical protein